MEWDGVVRGWGTDAGWDDDPVQRALPVYDQRIRATGRNGPTRIPVGAHPGARGVTGKARSRQAWGGAPGAL